MMLACLMSICVFCWFLALSIRFGDEPGYESNRLATAFGIAGWICIFLAVPFMK